MRRRVGCGVRHRDDEVLVRRPSASWSGPFDRRHDERCRDRGRERPSQVAGASACGPETPTACGSPGSHTTTTPRRPAGTCWGWSASRPTRTDDSLRRAPRDVPRLGRSRPNSQRLPRFVVRELRAFLARALHAVWRRDCCRESIQRRAAWREPRTNTIKPGCRGSAGRTRRSSACRGRRTGRSHVCDRSRAGAGSSRADHGS